MDSKYHSLHYEHIQRRSNREGSLRQFHFECLDSSASSGRMCRVSRLPDEKSTVQIICSIIHTLLKLHLKPFINTEAHKLAIVHVATSFLTIQTLDRPISTFVYIILHRVIYLLAHLWLTLAGIMHPLLVWVFILLCLFLMRIFMCVCIYIYIYIYI